MATNPQREGYERLGWPGKGKIMTEDEYHELERLSLDRKYEYIDGMAYMMSGGSVAHDRINRNIGYALDLQLRSGPCTVFGVDVQVLIGTKRNGKPQYVYPDATVSCDRADRRPDTDVSELRAEHDSISLKHDLAVYYALKTRALKVFNL